MLKQLKISIGIFVVMLLVTGVLYPLLVTGLAQVIFPYQANGSLVTSNNVVVGSTLIGQQFDQPQYFWGRLSATGDHPYNASASSGSNLGPTNPALQQQVSDRIAALKAADPTNTLPIPVDLVTASGSGLDPDISIASARYQANRVAQARGIPVQTVLNLIDQHIETPQLGFLGETRVNVLALNLALDGLK
jgi:potassium-transporting ATPase KdpC subunit